jgi:hypothetical protein
MSSENPDNRTPHVQAQPCWQLPRAVRSLISRRAAALAAIGLVACGGVIYGCSSDSAGPLASVMAQGQPYLVEGGIPVAPGQDSQTTAYIQNRGKGVATLLSATVVPLPGWAVGQLANIGVGTTLDSVAAGQGWPPSVPVKAFDGAKIPPGESRIIFGITGTTPGKNYVAAGIRIRYQYAGHDYSFMAWAGVIGCVMKPSQVHLHSSGPYCDRAGNSFYASLLKDAGQ